MTYKEMLFKGNRVFVEVDGGGKVVEEKGRASMKYRLEDDMVYRPFASNLLEKDNERAPTVAQPKGADEKETARLVGKRQVITAYTDGACIGNPGPAGLGYLIVFPDGRRVEKGEPLGRATNNIAELTAILRVAEIARGADLPIIIHSDSSYSIGVLSKGWKAKANPDLIAKIKTAFRAFPRVELRKVKGHAGVRENEIVDRLARTAAETQRTV